MATTTAKTPAAGKTAAAPPSPQQDSRLLNYVRTNIQPIVAGLIAMAARCGEERDWTGMSEYQKHASQLSQLGGLGTPAAGTTGASHAAMAAGAGAA